MSEIKIRFPPRRRSEAFSYKVKTIVWLSHINLKIMLTKLELCQPIKRELRQYFGNGNRGEA